MPTFLYIATDNTGKAINGSVEMTDRATVLQSLVKQGLRPVSIKESASKSGGLSIGGLLGSRGVKSDDLVMFTRQLSAMVGAGVPLLRGLSSLEAHAESPVFKKIIGTVIKDVEGGMPLADALEKHPKVYNSIYVNMVRAGEAAGILDDILKRLALQQEKSASIRKKVKSAMTYPTVLIVITIGAFFGLMLFVIPQIGNIIKDLGGPDAELPALTLMMLAISGFLINFWYIVFPAMFGGIFLIIKYIRSPSGKKKFDRILLKLPGVNTIIKKVAIARFTRTFSALMGAGVAVLESLTVTARGVGNSAYEEALLKAAEEVENGKPLSHIIEANPLFPPIVAQMLSVGEETGQTDVVLIKVADFYEEEVDAAIDSISSIIEPVMIVVMGGMVGLIAASVMMPIAGLSNTIQE